MRTIDIEATAIGQFRRKGWAKLEGIFDEDEVETLGRVLDHAIANPPDLEAQFGLSKEELAAKDPIAQDDESYSQILKAYRDLRRIYPELDAIITSPRMGDIGRALLGVDHVQLYAESFLIKPPEVEGSRPTPWHQDWPLVPFDRRDCFNLWIAVSDVGPDDGPIQVVPGSHRLGSFGVQDFAEDTDFHSLLRDEDLELIEPVETVTLRAGDAVAFQSLTLHHADINRSKRERRAYQTFWIGSEVCYTGMPNMKTDGLGLQPDRFPLVS